MDKNENGEIKYRDKGYGKTAMLKFIEIVSKKYEVDTVYLSIIGENKIASNL